MHLKFKKLLIVISTTNLELHTYLIIAGEQSADNHGTLLMKAMQTHTPEIEFRGIGGKKMIDAGLNSIEDIDKMAVMGFIEVIKHLPFFMKLKKRVLENIESEKYDHIILIDYPGFNLNLLPKLKNDHEVTTIDLEYGQDLNNCSLPNDIDVVIHLAGRSGVRDSIKHPNAYFQNNVIASLRIFEKYKNARIIYASSSTAEEPDKNPYAYSIES